MGKPKRGRLMDHIECWQCGTRFEVPARQRQLPDHSVPWVPSCKCPASGRDVIASPTVSGRQYQACHISREKLLDWVRPSGLAEIQDYQYTVRFLVTQVDMLFSDLRCLLLFPCAVLDTGFNLTAVSLLFNILAGISVCFHNPSLPVLTDHRKHPRGEKFKELLTNYYPWEGEPLSIAEAVDVLYVKARNPLAHSLGLDSPTSQDPSSVHIGKHFLTEEEIMQLEGNQQRPKWLRPTVDKQNSDFVISVPTFYWGTWRLLQKLFRDKDQMIRAEEFLKQLDQFASV